MKKSVIAKVLGGVLVSVLVLVVGVSLLLAKPGKTDLSLLVYIKDVLTNGYVEKNVDENKLIYGAIRGMLESLDDPYTRFMEPKSYTEMKIRMDAEFFGIGIHIGMKDNQLTVISTIYNTPAYHAGLKPMDKIMTIDGQSTKGLSLTEAVNKIRGPKGVPVNLGILEVGETTVKPFSIPRDKIHIDAVEKSEVFRGKIGYLKLATFESQVAADELKAATQKLLDRKISALVIDLRDNGGGLLNNAISISGLFISDGDVVHTVNRDGQRTTRSVHGTPIYKGPLVILMNQGSASASEILAGAIKDNKRGTIIGATSFGKASVQNILPLEDGSAVLYTIAKYLTPAGTDISKKGIAPDVEVIIPTENLKQLYDPTKYRYQDDPQLQKALDVLEAQLKK